MNCFASWARRQGQSERAAGLWGAAEALLEEIALPLYRHRWEEFERQIAFAKDTLGEEAFAAAWEAGRAMTWEQAVAYALEEPVE